MSGVDYDYKPPLSEQSKTKKGSPAPRRQFLKYGAVAAGSAALAVAGRFLAGSRGPATPPPTPTLVDKKPATATSLTRPEQVPSPKIFIGPDYAKRIPAELQLAPSTDRFLKVEKAVVEILPSHPSLSHPRAADEKGTDPYFWDFIWTVGEYQSRLATPAENVIKNPNQGSGPIRLYGNDLVNLFSGVGQLLSVPLALYIPEAVLEPYLKDLDGLNVYVDNRNLDPQGSSLHPLNPNTDGPSVNRINIKTLGWLNGGIVRGSPLTPGRYHLISFMSHVRIVEGMPSPIPPPIPQTIRLIFWDKGTDPINQNLKKLAIEL